MEANSVFQSLLFACATTPPAAVSLSRLTLICLRIGGESGVVLELHRACKRCSVTTFHPDTATPDVGAQTLVTLRTQRAAHADAGETVGLFGQYAIHQNNGHILLNQEIEVLEYKRQSDRKHPLVIPNQFVPHMLQQEFRSFRVSSISCDEPTNPRPTYRLKLEVELHACVRIRFPLVPHVSLQVHTSAAKLPSGWHVKVPARSAPALFLACAPSFATCVCGVFAC